MQHTSDPWFRVDLSLSLHFGVRVYVKSSDYRADSNRCISEAPEEACSDGCQFVGCGGESMGFGVVQTGV